MHANSNAVSLFNSCTGIAPMDIVDLLNRLYCVMDFLAVRFKLYKGELPICPFRSLDWF